MTTQPPKSAPGRTSHEPISATLATPAATAAYLRAELAGASEGGERAALLHAMGGLLERAGDDAGAAREYLAAISASPEFREPLEGLAALLHRRRSVKNLGKVLDSLVRAAVTSEEKSRALVERAAFALEHAGDAGQARASLEEAVEVSPDDVTAWLELEVLAGREGRDDDRRRALQERAAQAEPSAWRALLLIDMAALEARAGDVDRAAETLRASADLEGGSRYRSYVAIAELARRERRDALLADALAAQADLLDRAMADASAGDGWGVPHDVRSKAVLADVLVRAAYAARRAGDAARAGALLDRALEALPSEPTLLSARMSVADVLGDTDESAKLARVLLERGAAGPEAASLWLRVEEEAATRGDRDGVMTALAAAVQADPGCIPARTMQTDFLTTFEGTAEAASLASSLEALAEQLTSDAAKGRAFLRAAWEWAAGAGDAAAAKRSLSQAGALGVSPSSVARVARTLASLQGDVAWHEESTRRLLTAGASADEQAGLWFELGRARLLRGESEAARKAWEGLAAAPGGSWLAAALDAYTSFLPPPGGPREPAPRAAEALDALAKAEPEASFARALAVIAARRAQAAGDAAGAEKRLRDLLDADATDVLVATYLAQLCRARGDEKAAAEVLHTTASAVSDQALSAALNLEAGFLLWRAGERGAALEPLRAARVSAPEAATPALLWALRAVQPNERRARLQALELAVESGACDPVLGALERFGLELGAEGEIDDAHAALATLEEKGTSDLETAGALVRLLWGPAAGDRAAVERALDVVAKASKGGVTLAAGERVRIARDVDGDPDEHLARAAAWAAADPSPATGLEWLAAALKVGDRGAEASAHRLLASGLEGAARAAEEAAASTVTWLTGGRPNPLPTTEAPAQLFNLELAPAGTDPRRRAAALRGLDGALGDEAALDALGLAGWSDLARGDVKAALSTFRKVTDKRPRDLSAWEGVRAAADEIGDAAAVAAASAKLGELCADDARAAAYWEHAGLLCLETLGQPDAAEHALAQAFTRDPSRAVAFDKLFRRVRDRNDDDVLLGLIGHRLEVADDTAEIAKLYWERARVLRKKGDQDGALDALTNVTLLEPDHVGALALAGEIHIKKGQYAEAAEALARLAAQNDAPAQQRMMSGVAAVDLYEKRLGRPDLALEALLTLHRAGLSTLAVRERLAIVAGKTGAWVQAASVLEELMVERDTPEGRVAAARLAMAIWRDKVGEPENAQRAVRKLLEESPGDGEAVDLMLDAEFDEPVRRSLLGASKGALLAATTSGPLDPAAIERLGRVARATDDAPLLQAALGVFVALGGDGTRLAGDFAALDQRTAKVPQIQVDRRAMAAIADPLDAGPIVALFELLGEVIGEALGPSKDVLGVGRRERVDPRGGLPLRNEIAAWAGALGLGEFELYVGGRDPKGVQGVAGEVPALVVGAEVTSPLSAASRQAVARELFALRRGTGVVRTRDEATVASIAVAACNLVDVRLNAPAFAMLGDVQRQLGRAMTRKVKKTLPEVCLAVADARPDVRAWAAAAARSLDRVAAVAAGDVSLVLADALNVPRAQLRGVIASDPRAEGLLRFVLSTDYLDLRRSLGMGVR